MPKCKFNKVAFPLNLLHIFGTRFSKHSSVCLLWYQENPEIHKNIKIEELRKEKKIWQG